jgi:hypothetical protein
VCAGRSTRAASRDSLRGCAANSFGGPRQPLCAQQPVLQHGAREVVHDIAAGEDAMPSLRLHARGCSRDAIKGCLTRPRAPKRGSSTRGRCCRCCSVRRCRQRLAQATAGAPKAGSVLVPSAAAILASQATCRAPGATSRETASCGRTRWPRLMRTRAQRRSGVDGRNGSEATSLAGWEVVRLLGAAQRRLGLIVSHLASPSRPEPAP